jgi:hypothetical protein
LAASVVADFDVGIYWGLTENKPRDSPVRMYIDYDYIMNMNSLAAESRRWDDVERIQMEEVMRFFPDVPSTSDLFQATVLASGATRVDKPLEAGGDYKAGIHVVFSNLCVTVDMALYITAAIIQRLEREQMFVDDAPGLWTKRVDQAVYADGRGLRWAWQLKTTQCPYCVATTGLRDRCRNLCSNGTMVDKTSSMYTPVYALDGTCKRTTIECRRDSPTVELLMLSSIRGREASVASADGFVLYAGHPPLPRLMTKRSKAADGVSGGGGTVSVAFSGDTGGAAAGRQELVLYTDARFEVITKVVQRMHDAYQRIAVQKIVVKPKPKGYTVAVTGEGSCFCMNYGKDHRAQRVKFYIGPLGIVQECWCKCDVVRTPNNVRCKDFKSKPFTLSDAEKAVLFPQATPARKYVVEAGEADEPVPLVSAVAGVVVSSDDSSVFQSFISNSFGEVAVPGGREGGQAPVERAKSFFVKMATLSNKLPIRLVKK